MILYTECDVGAKRDSLSDKWRAHQNVVFKHGYLIGKLQRARAAALVKGDVETPNDISGAISIGMDLARKWHDEINIEPRHSGYEIPSPA